MRRCVDKADCVEFCQSEKSIWPHPKSLSALSLFVNLGNSEESLSSVCSAATLALLCFAIDPRQSGIHTTLGFQQRKFSSILRYLPLKKLYKKQNQKVAIIAKLLQAAATASILFPVSNTVLLNSCTHCTTLVMVDQR